MIVLVTAFDPFGGESLNPALEAVKRLPDCVGGVEIVKKEIPTQFVRSGEVLRQVLSEVHPDAVLLVGQAGGRKALTPERVAINLKDASIPDNAGDQPTDEPVIPGGPAAYFSTLPVKEIAAAIRETGVPAELSCTAGTFVCNSLFYLLMHELSQWEAPVPGGFLHVPFLPEQTAGKPGVYSLPMEQLLPALNAAVTVIAEKIKRRFES